MSLLIGQYVAHALGEENAPELWYKIGGRLAPVVQPEDAQTLMPYVWYSCESIVENSTKDGHLSDVCTVQIEVVATTYMRLLELLQLVRSAMEEARNTWELQEQLVPFHIDEQTFSAGPEEYDDMQQAYCRKLIYTIETYE